MIEMLYVLLLEIILITCFGCTYIPEDDDQCPAITKTSKNEYNAVCADLVFSGQVEDIYRTYELSLQGAGTAIFVSPFVATMSNIAGKKLQTLLQEAMPEISHVCSHQDVQQTFHNVCQQIRQKVELNKRMQCWLAFITSLSQVQQAMRAERLSQIWFPGGADSGTQQDFIRKNEHLMLDETEKKYLAADTVITFLPFALMARHDPKMLAVTRCMQAR